MKKNTLIFGFAVASIICTFSQVYGIGISPGRGTVVVPENNPSCNFSNSYSLSRPSAYRYSRFSVLDPIGIEGTITGCNVSTGIEYLDDKTIQIDWQSEELSSLGSIVVFTSFETPTPWQCPIEPGSNCMYDFVSHSEVLDCGSGTCAGCAVVSQLSLWRNYSLKGSITGLQEHYLANGFVRFNVDITDYTNVGLFLQSFDFSYSIDWESDGIIDESRSGVRMHDQSGQEDNGYLIVSGFLYKTLALEHIYPVAGNYLITLNLIDKETTTIQIPVEVVSEPAYHNAGVDGSEEHPYLIDSIQDIMDLSGTTSDYNKHFMLSTDIDLSNYIFSASIIAPDTQIDISGFQGTPFTGVFDGKGHKISNLTINGGKNDYIGLFGQVEDVGVVKNLGIVDCNVSGNYDVGGLAGFINAGHISNCYSTGSVSGSGFVGGLVGWNEGAISNCYSTGAVSGGYQSWDLGGLVGVSISGSSISYCYSTGSVSVGSNSSEVGGLVGTNDNDGNSIVSSFWDIQSSMQTTSAGGTGLITAGMKTKSTFTDAGWDFTTIWAICEGTNYPRLRWQMPAADLVCPDGVNFVDFAYFAARWPTTSCDSSNNFCGGADMDTSGTVDIFDLAEFAEYWLSGS